MSRKEWISHPSFNFLTLSTPMMSYIRIPLVSTLFCAINAYWVRLLSKRTIGSIRQSTSDNVLLAVSDLRKEYSKAGLNEQNLPLEPYTLFNTWFKDACDAKVLEPNAMCLSTCKDNIPSARFVLLKAFNEDGFVWYTNYESRKSDELLINPNAALTFWWGDLERSIRIEGTVDKVSKQESDEYFYSRPRGSQIGAWTSAQSRPIENREVLEKQEKDVLNRFNGSVSATSDPAGFIPRPEHWGGFRLTPTKIEFWKGRESRIHDRILYQRVNSKEKRILAMSDSSLWTRTRLQP